MTTELLSHENDKATYTTQVDWKTFEEAVEDVYRRNRGRFQIPGFRKGHAPRKIIEMNYGEGIFYEDALNQVLPDAIDAAMKELELEPIGQPEVDVKDFEKGDPITFEIITETMPHPELGDYKTIEVEERSVTVDDEQIDGVIEGERNKNAVMVQVDDRPAQEGDEVTINYSGSVAGEAFEGGSAEDQKLELGSNSFIPGFEDQVIGHSVGEEFDIDVTFPEDYGAEDLAGKEAVFHIMLKEIAVKEVPELDDDFAQDVSEFDTLEEYRDSIRKDLEEKQAQANRAEQENQAIQKLIEISDVHVPEVMIEEQVDHEIRDMAQQIQQLGIGMEQYLEYTGSDMDQLREQYRGLAETRVAGDLVLASLIEEQDIEVGEEELDAELERLGELYGAQDTEDFKKRVKEAGNDALVAEDLKKKKAIDYLMEQVTFVEAKEEPAEEETEVEQTEEATDDSQDNE